MSETTEPLGAGLRRTVSSARAAALVGTRRNTRSRVGNKMGRDEEQRGRAGQALELGEPGVADRTTGNSLAAGCCGLPQDDQVAKTKLLAGRCLWNLDQGLGQREDYWRHFIFPCEAGLGALDRGRFRVASRCALSIWCGPKADQSRQRRESLAALPRVVRRGTWLATAAAVRPLLAPIAATRETG